MIIVDSALTIICSAILYRMDGDDTIKRWQWFFLMALLIMANTQDVVLIALWLAACALVKTPSTAPLLDLTWKKSAKLIVGVKRGGLALLAFVPMAIYLGSLTPLLGAVFMATGVVYKLSGKQTYFEPVTLSEWIVGAVLGALLVICTP